LLHAYENALGSLGFSIAPLELPLSLPNSLSISFAAAPILVEASGTSEAGLSCSVRATKSFARQALGFTSVSCLATLPVENSRVALGVRWCPVHTIIVNVEGEQNPLVLTSCSCVASIECLKQRLGDFSVAIRAAHNSGGLPTRAALHKSLRVGADASFDVLTAGGFVVAAPTLCAVFYANRAFVSPQ
jgi:hypothetical protein